MTEIGQVSARRKRAAPIEALLGAGIEWLYSGPHEAVGARLNGKMVAIVMPCVNVTAKGGDA